MSIYNGKKNIKSFFFSFPIVQLASVLSGSSMPLHRRLTWWKMSGIASCTYTQHPQRGNKGVRLFLFFFKSIVFTDRFKSWLWKCSTHWTRLPGRRSVASQTFLFYIEKKSLYCDEGLFPNRWQQSTGVWCVCYMTKRPPIGSLFFWKRYSASPVSPILRLFRLQLHSIGFYGRHLRNVSRWWTPIFPPLRKMNWLLYIQVCMYSCPFSYTAIWFHLLAANTQRHVFTRR